MNPRSRTRQSVSSLDSNKSLQQRRFGGGKQTIRTNQSPATSSAHVSVIPLCESYFNCPVRVNISTTQESLSPHTSATQTGHACSEDLMLELFPSSLEHLRLLQRTQVQSPEHIAHRFLELWFQEICCLFWSPWATTCTCTRPHVDTPAYI